MSAPRYAVEVIRPARAHYFCRIMFAAGLAAGGAVQAQSPTEFRCSGSLETRVWQTWDSSERSFLHDEIMVNRLKKMGDTYALYDMQTYTQNLVAMAARCGRTSRLKELAELIGMAFDELVAVPGATPDSGKGWICRGGRVCNTTNKLIGTEINLNSRQFIAIAMRVAGVLANAPDWPANRPFVERSIVTAVHHLQRWSAGRDPMHLTERLRASAADVHDGQSRLFVTDQDLWIIAIAAEVAGVLAARPELASTLPNDGLSGAPRTAVVGLLELFKARTTELQINSEVTGRVIGADIDRGFWRLYRDSRYAGYTGSEKPVECTPGQPSHLVLAPENVKVVDTIGWDFSHARRLVPVMDVLERNRAALQRVFNVPATAVPSPQLANEYAAELAGVVWTGDRDWPLFTNYWDGTNGWYRVAYDNGTNNCVEGYPPSGLSEAFVTGGYVVWARYYPVIGELGERIYAINTADDSVSREFIAANYSQLSPSASASNRMLTQLMFWPTLIH